MFLVMVKCIRRLNYLINKNMVIFFVECCVGYVKPIKRGDIKGFYFAVLISKVITGLCKVS